MATFEEFREEVYLVKGRIVSLSSLYEQKMDFFITRHFMGDKETTFTNDVLEQEYFSFELKKRIFYKILKRDYPECWKTFPCGDLDDLQGFRNIAAHGAIVADPDGGEGDNPAYLRHGGKSYSITKIRDDFEKVNGPVESAFDTLPVSEDETDVAVQISGIG